MGLSRRRLLAGLGLPVLAPAAQAGPDRPTRTANSRSACATG